MEDPPNAAPMDLLEDDELQNDEVRLSFLFVFGAMAAGSGQFWRGY